MIPTNSPSPTHIEPFSPSEMMLAWNTDEKFAVPYTELRFTCPCASCVDEHTGQRLITRSQVKPDVRPTGANVVGRYAVSIQWNDGHSTGIYHYDRLYELCRSQGRSV